jgi:hypothetical protein
MSSAKFTNVENEDLRYTIYENHLNVVGDSKSKDKYGIGLLNMPLLSPQQYERLNAWLAESSELYVAVYRVRGGGSGDAYFCRGVAEIEELLAKQTWPKVVVHIFHRIQYPLRGVANQELLAKALEQIPDGEWFHFVSLDHYYPSSCSWCGSGNSHTELRQEFAEIIGERVGIGYDPFDRDDSWMSKSPDEVMILDVDTKEKTISTR